MLVMGAWGGLLLKDFLPLNNLFFSLTFPHKNVLDNFKLLVRRLIMPLPGFHQNKSDHHCVYKRILFRSGF